MEKNILLAAILNMIVPGSRYIYIYRKKWVEAIVEFVIGIAGYVIFFLASKIYPLVIFILPVGFFIDGLTAAYSHNKKISKT